MSVSNLHDLGAEGLAELLTAVATAVERGDPVLCLEPKVYPSAKRVRDLLAARLDDARPLSAYESVRRHARTIPTHWLLWCCAALRERERTGRFLTADHPLLVQVYTEELAGRPDRPSNADAVLEPRQLET